MGLFHISPAIQSYPDTGQSCLRSQPWRSGYCSAEHNLYTCSCGAEIVQHLDLLRNRCPVAIKGILTILGLKAV